MEAADRYTLWPIYHRCSLNVKLGAKAHRIDPVCIEI
jgi:hypothetical protein